MCLRHKPPVSRLLSAALAFCLLGALFARPVLAQETTHELVKVEETWELRVGQPNLERNAPQVTMVMSPFSDLESRYFIYTLNHRTSPDYSDGGMQVQLWNGEEVEDYCNGPNGAPLQIAAETVTWTQELSISGGVVTMEVRDGQSQSWGAFGGQGYLRKSITTGLQNLNTYRPQLSIEESGIGYAGNLVDSLILKRIRWTMSSGQVYELTAPIDIDSDLDPWD